MDRRSLFVAFFGLMAALSLWVVLSLQFPYNIDGFGIVSNRDNTIVVKDGDIEYYNATSHDLVLTRACVERLMENGHIVGPFTIKVGGEDVLNGIFVPPITSRSYPSSQVVIIYPSFDSNYGMMRIQMGYPWDEAVGQDPRDYPRISQYFEATHRLVQ